MKERGLSDGDPRLLPSTFPYYSLTLLCTHGIDHPKKGKGKRQRRIIRYLACGAKVNALSRRSHDGEWKVHVSWENSHNHLRSEELFRYYAENRRITDPAVLDQAGKMKKAGASAKGILQHLREETGKSMDLRDVHNLLAAGTRKNQGRKTDEERTVSLLREFCETDGNAATLSVDDSSGLVHAVCFQTARQKRLFKAFPEVILVDTTHDTNKNKYKLFSIQVDDVFGKELYSNAGQYVYHSLVESEMADNLSFCLKEFKESNPAWVNIRVVVTDKDFNEKDVLADAFPDARQLLCQFHVIDYLRKQVGSRCGRGAEDKKNIIAALQLMMKAESATAYSAYREEMLRSLGNDKKDAFFEYFEVNWETCKEEWVNYRRDNVPHLNNHTNNRIESGWGKIKQVVEREDPIDELIGTLIMLQEWSEEGYMKEFRSLGTRQTPIAEDAVDPELLTLAVQLSPHAYRLVREQYKFACSAEASYEV
ncbi:hypothetical protein PR001_g1608 [Phytophthora rubi]|uniref:ZSWIM1/3 RNaseH-like domain-containing protein n=1 Tax=Phytophthora rubi TaxID=129364 RepID=A0A6A3P6W0_9STRA|nr:hypothetical protein PR001_g1608 [Phytophthora rubi]